MADPNIERRGFIRIKDNLQTEIVTNRNSFNSYTKNISASGMLCWAAEPLMLMSKVKIVLSIPSYKTITSKKIDCYGTVVRFEPSNLSKIQEGYNIAIKFTDIKDNDQDFIDSYVKEKIKDVA